jgi:hypothetical protein
VSIRARIAIRDERGQSLVFVVLAIPILIGTLALVIDVGGWFRAQRRAQSVADAAALAAAQDLPDTTAATQTALDSAQQNWPGIPDPTVQFPAAGTIEVVAQHDVAGTFAPLAGLFSLKITARASASLGIPTQLDAVAPLAVACQDPSCDPWDPTRSYVLTYDRRDPGGSTLAPVALPGVTNGNFRRFVSCDASTPRSSDCNQSLASAPSSYTRLNRPAAQVRGGIDDGNSATHLVPVFDRFSGGSYHVVGWAAATLSVLAFQGQTVQVRATFERFYVDSKLPGVAWLSSGGTGGTIFDFGVRALALTG